MAKTAILAEPVLVGREKELEELQTFLNSAIEGEGKTVFVSGEAGSGKTRLTQEFLKTAIKHGVAIMAGWCLSDSQAPFFPFIEAFNNYYYANSEQEQPFSFEQPQHNFEATIQLGVEEQEVTSWLAGPKVVGKAEKLSPQVWKDQALAAIAETMNTIALQAPVILFIEDLHWADSASLALFHYLSRAVKDSHRILLLATFRSEELGSDHEGHPNPLAETLRMMRREELFSEIKLPSLDQESVSKLAESMIGACLQREFLEKLEMQSGGSPLYIVESLRMLNEQSGLIKDGTCFRLGVETAGIPSKIKDIILRRLGLIGREQRRVLDAASVTGEEFDVDFLSTVLGQDPLEVLETLNQIAHSTSLVRVEGDHYRFDHARSRETLYEELALPLKRGYHSRIAEKLEGAGAANKLSDIAYHYAQAGCTEKAAKYALAAGKDELAKYSNAQAIEHFQYVLENVQEGQAEARSSAMEGLGDAYLANCQYDEAIKTFENLAAVETGIVKLRAFRKLTDAAYIKGDKPDLLLEYAKKAQELGVVNRLEMARILSNRAKAWGWAGRGDFKRDLADYNAALQVFEEENSLFDAAEALCRSGIVSCFFEETQEKGVGEFLRSIAIFRELGDVRKEIDATLWAGVGFGNCSLSSEAIREYARVLVLGEKIGVFSELAQASFHLVSLLLLGGKFGDVVQQGLKTLEYCKKTDANWIQGCIYAFLTESYTFLSDLKRADVYFEKMNNMPPELLSNWFFIISAGSATATYFAAQGRWIDSNQAFEKLIDFVEKYHVPSIEALFRRAYALTLENQGRYDESKLQFEKSQRLLDVFGAREKKFDRANIQLSVMLPRRFSVGEEVEMRLDLVNVGRKPALLAKISGVALSEFKFLELSSFCNLKGDSFMLREKNVGPFEIETIRLKFMAMKAGVFALIPEAFYLDDLGNTKTFKVDPITVAVLPAKPAYEVLPGRVMTGTKILDKLLLGGIPARYVVALSASSSDERQQIIKRFIETGAASHEITIYLTCEVAGVEELAQTHQNDFYVGVCNPQVDAILPNLPNIIKFKGTENLTEIDIAFAKLLRTIDPAQSQPRRVLIDLLSDILLQHHAVATRRWLSGLIATLKSKGFTVLAVVDPLISPEEVPTIAGLFDGEIRITEKQSEKGIRKVLQISKLINQRYVEKELLLTKENMRGS